jgi:hypothetical protein
VIRRAMLAAAVLFGLGAALALPAQADPGQICVVYSHDRSAICIEIGDTPIR